MLADLPGRAAAGVRRHRFSLLVFVGCEAVLVLWWLAFFPVLVSPDSMLYVVEATTNHWSTDFSVLYDALVWLSLETTHSVAALVLVQLSATAAALAYVAGGLRRLGTTGWVTGVLMPVCLVVPALGTFPLYLWKDVPFTIAGLWLFGLLIRIVDARVRDDDATRSGTVTWVRWSFVAALLLCLSRNNGFVFLVIAALALLVLWRRTALRLVSAMLLGAAAAAVLTTAVFPLMGVRRAQSDLVLGPAYDDIAYVYHREPRAIGPADRRLLARVAPLPLWRSAGNCYTADDLTQNIAFDRVAASANSGHLFALWLRLVVDHPVAMTTARLCRGYIAWSPVAGPRDGATIFPLTYEKHSRFLVIPNATWRRALEPAPVNAQLHHVAQAYDLDSYSLEPLLWRGATWSYVAYAVVLLAWWRTRRRSVLALGVLTLGVQVGVLVDNPNQLVRYMILPLYLGPMLLPLLTLRRDAGPGRAETPPDASDAM